jgi:hypothetical protein
MRGIVAELHRHDLAEGRMAIRIRRRELMVMLGGAVGSVARAAAGKVAFAEIAAEFIRLKVDVIQSFFSTPVCELSGLRQLASEPKTRRH